VLGHFFTLVPRVLFLDLSLLILAIRVIIYIRTNVYVCLCVYVCGDIVYVYIVYFAIGFRLSVSRNDFQIIQRHRSRCLDVHAGHTHAARYIGLKVFLFARGRFKCP